MSVVHEGLDMGLMIDDDDYLSLNTMKRIRIRGMLDRCICVFGTSMYYVSNSSTINSFDTNAGIAVVL